MNTQNNELIDGEISLRDLLKSFKENWKKVFIGGIASGIFGMIYAFILPSIYQATANIQVAKIAGSDVESPNILVEKLKMPTYYTQNTFSACHALDSLEPGNDIIQQLKPVLSKFAPIISITYKEEGIDEAKKCLLSVLADIQTNQNILAKPILESKKNQLDSLKQKLESAEQIVKLLSVKNSSFDFSDSKFSASTLLLSTTLSKENEIKDLRTQISDLEIALAEPQTKQAFLTTPIYAPTHRAEPKRILITLISGIVGGILVIGYLMGRRFFLKIQLIYNAV